MTMKATGWKSTWSFPGWSRAEVAVFPYAASASGGTAGQPCTERQNGTGPWPHPDFGNEITISFTEHPYNKPGNLGVQMKMVPLSRKCYRKSARFFSRFEQELGPFLDITSTVYRTLCMVQYKQQGQKASLDPAGLEGSDKSVSSTIRILVTQKCLL